MFYTKLALASVVNNRRQYLSLFCVCFVCVSLILGAVIVTDGMLSSVKQKARQYYGGDVQFLGGTRATFWLKEKEDFEALFESIVGDEAAVFTRFDYNARLCEIFYEGESMRQRQIKGVDFAKEKPLFDTFTFVEGNANELPNHLGIIISEPIAQKLGVHAGDMVTLQLITYQGHINTFSFIVTGIFQDSSLFGLYTSYIDQKMMWEATGYPDCYVNRLSLYYKNHKVTKAQLRALQAALSEHFAMYPLTDDKYELIDAADASPTPLYGLIELNANIKDLKAVIDAIQIVRTALILVLLAIVSVGISSTYRVIVMRRTTDIGIYRSLGMKPSGVRKLFLLEISWLLLVGYIAGILLTVLGAFVLSRFTFSFIPAFDIFLQNGHLLPQVRGNILKLLGVMVIITVTTLVSVLFTIRKVVHQSPVGALATTT